jgi:hypothetical protein
MYTVGAMVVALLDRLLTGLYIGLYVGMGLQAYRVSREPALNRCFTGKLHVPYADAFEFKDVQLLLPKR